MSIVVLISGSGSNLQALIDAKLPAPITHVISSSSSAYGLERAKKAGIPTTVHSLQKYYGDLPKDAKDERKTARQKFNKDLAQLVIEFKPTLVVCAGWMLILAPSFLQPLAAASIDIINLHPALPGAFPGIHAIDRAWEGGQKGELTKGGVMIHYVIAAVDEGEPLIVKEIDLRKDESLDEYTERVHSVEHIAIVEGTLKALAAESKTPSKTDTASTQSKTESASTEPKTESEPKTAKTESEPKSETDDVTDQTREKLDNLNL